MCPIKLYLSSTNKYIYIKLMLLMVVTLQQAPTLQKRNSMKTNALHVAKLKPDVSCIVIIVSCGFLR